LAVHAGVDHLAPGSDPAPMELVRAGMGSASGTPRAPALCARGAHHLLPPFAHLFSAREQPSEGPSADASAARRGPPASLGGRTRSESGRAPGRAPGSEVGDRIAPQPGVFLSGHAAGATFGDRARALSACRWADVGGRTSADREPKWQSSRWRTSDCRGCASSGCFGYLGAARRRTPGQRCRGRTSAHVAGVDAQNRELVWRFVVGRRIAGCATAPRGTGDRRRQRAPDFATGNRFAGCAAAPFGGGDGWHTGRVLVRWWRFPSHSSSAVGCWYGGGWEGLAGRCGRPGGPATPLDPHPRGPRGARRFARRQRHGGGSATAVDAGRCRRWGSAGAFGDLGGSGQLGCWATAFGARDRGWPQGPEFTIRQWCADHSPAAFDAWCRGFGRARKLSVRTRNKGCGAPAVLAGSRFRWRGRTNQRVVWTRSSGGPAAPFRVGHGRIGRGTHRLVVG
jgi:hypothetical protein